MLDEFFLATGRVCAEMSSLNAGALLVLIALLPIALAVSGIRLLTIDIDVLLSNIIN